LEVYADLWLVGLGGLGALAVALVGLHELAHWVKRDWGYGCFIMGGGWRLGSRGGGWSCLLREVRRSFVKYFEFYNSK
jgi:hypothetical protein